MCSQVVALLPRLGWSVPDPEPNRHGTERKRSRGKGFVVLLPECRDKVVATYSLEYKRYTLHLNLSLFGEDLNSSKGVEPKKEKGKQYDIVTHTNRAKTALPPRTLARARAAFDPEVYGGM